MSDENEIETVLSIEGEGGDWSVQEPVVREDKKLSNFFFLL